MHIRFGVNFMPSAPVLEVVEWARAVERHGYDLLGISDSQSISRDVYVTLGHCATATTRIRFGSRVDIFVPAGVQVRAKVGDVTKAGQTVIAEWP